MKEGKEERLKEEGRDRGEEGHTSRHVLSRPARAFCLAAAALGFGLWRYFGCGGPLLSYLDAFPSILFSIDFFSRFLFSHGFPAWQNRYMTLV